MKTNIHRLPLHQHLLIVLGLSCAAVVLALMLRGSVTPALPFSAAVLSSALLFGMRGGFSAMAICGTLTLLLVVAEMRSGWVDFAAFVALDSVLVVFIDKKQRRLTQFDQVLSSLPDSLVISDSGGLIVYMNDRAEALLGVPLQQAHGKPLSEVVKYQEEKSGKPAAPPVEETLRGAETLTASGARRLILSREGPPIEVEESMVPLRTETGKIAGTILTLRDATRRREAENQLSRSQKMDAIARLSGGLAGDFNGLLTVITGFGEMIRFEVAPNDPARRFADEILFAADRAAAVTRQLMALSRQQSGQTRIVDLNACITGMETMLKRLLGDRIALLLMPGPGVGKIKADPGQLEQMFLNLAMNARDAMPKGGQFLIETSTIEIESTSPGRPESLAHGSYALISVSDTGIGMDAETRSQLFEPFFTTKGQGKSTGLGLSIVYGVVRQCGGDIGVYSQPGAGTVFEIYFPRTKDTEGWTKPLPPGRGPRGNETILVADDDDGVRKLVHAVLATSGYTVIETMDGREALAAYQSDPGKFDLVLTDVVMPHLDGLALGDRISAVHPEQKILYMSGFRDSPTVGNADPDRLRPFIHKPFTPDSLLTRVREMLDSRLGASASGPT